MSHDAIYRNRVFELEGNIDLMYEKYEGSWPKLFLGRKNPRNGPEKLYESITSLASPMDES